MISASAIRPSTIAVGATQDNHYQQQQQQHIEYNNHHNHAAATSSSSSSSSKYMHVSNNVHVYRLMNSENRSSYNAVIPEHYVCHVPPNVVNGNELVRANY